MARKLRSVVQDVVVRFGGDANGLLRTLDRVERATQSAAQRVRSLGAGIASAFGVGAGLGGLGSAAAVTELADRLDELNKSAAELGVGVEALNNLRFAISQTSRLTDQEFNNVLQKLIKQIGAASRGSREAQAIFRELGLSWEYLASLGTAEAFLEVVDTLNKMDDSFARGSLSQKLFEDSWRRLNPVLDAGRENLEALAAQSASLGGPTAAAAQAASDFNDQVGKLNQALSALAYEYGPPLLEIANEFARRFLNVGGSLDDSLNDALARMRKEIADLQVALETWREILPDASIAKLESRIEALTERYESYRDSLIEVRKQEARAAEARKENADAPRRAPPPALPKTPSRRRSVPGASEGTGARERGEMRGIEERVERDIIDVLGEALAQFRQGTISATELGIRQGLQEQGTFVQPGSFGTLDNLTDAQANVELGVRLSPEDLNSLPDQLEQALQRGSQSGRYRVEIAVDVLPKLLGVDERVVDEADQRGARER